MFKKHYGLLISEIILLKKAVNVLRFQVTQIGLSRQNRLPPTERVAFPGPCKAHNKSHHAMECTSFL
jgi:hypothetical protein